MTTSLDSTAVNTATVEELRDHAVELVEAVAGGDEPLVITIGDRPKAVLVDYEKFDELEKTRIGAALLKILTERSRQIETGETLSVDEAFDEIEREMGWS